MAPQHVDIGDLAAATNVSTRSPDPADLVFRVTISSAVPPWFDDVAAVAARVGAGVMVTLAPDPEVSRQSAEARAGWEIGVLTAVLAAGIDEVHGAAPARLQRVRAVIDALASGSPQDLAT